MRVLQLLTQTRGGPVDHAVEVAVELARQGHDSHLAGPPGEHLTVAAGSGVRTHRVAVRSRHDLAGARAAAGVVGRVAPDVLHLQDRRAGLVGRLLAARQGRPSVYTLHGVPDQLAALVPGNLEVAARRRGDRWAYLRLERLLAATPRSAVVTPCAALAGYARDHVRVPADRVHAVPNGVGPSWLREPPTTTASETPTVRVVWLGVMQPVKRVPDLVRAAALVPEVELVLVGDGPERPRIEAAAAAAGSSARVRLTGHCADPAPHLRAGDVFVLPSAAEACPMALLQAMACGLPVVATRVGGVPEIVRHGRDGLLVPPGSPADLAAALALLAGRPALRHRLGAAGRARVATEFGIEHTVRSLLEIYAGVAG